MIGRLLCAIGSHRVTRNGYRVGGETVWLCRRPSCSYRESVTLP